MAEGRFSRRQILTVSLLGSTSLAASAALAQTGIPGSGVTRFFAPLAGSGKVNNEDATTVVRVILEGARAVPTPIAAVATFVRSSWDSNGGAVSAADVADLRERLADSLGPSR